MKNDLMQNHSIRARFLKDYALPFNIVRDPYYEYFIDLFDEDYDTRKYLHYLEGLLMCCSLPDEFFMKGESIRNEIISAISSTEGYSRFTSCKLSDYNIEHSNPPSGKLYIPQNDGQDFVSIDLVEANFNVLKFFDPRIFESFDYPESFREVVKHHTIHHYFLNSKRFRQVIFGSLNPKRQRKIQRWWVNRIIIRLQDEYVLRPSVNSIITISDDEIVLRDGAVQDEMFADLQNWCALPLRISKFKLERIGNHPYYLKRHTDGTIEIKGVPTYLMPQVYKIAKGMTINEYDKTFYFEKRLVRFVDALKREE